MISITRRNVLRAGGAVLGAAALPQLADPARAAAPPRNLIVVLNSGGWDVTYALDPKPDATRIDVPVGEHKRIGQIDVLSHAARPSVDAFFERYGALTALIRGVQVRSFIHNDCTKRILTGTPSDQNADFAAIAAHELGRELPVPYLVLGNSALSGPYAALTGRAGTTNQLSSLLDPDGYFITPAAYAPNEHEESLVRRYLAASADRVAATRGRSAGNRKQIEAFQRSLEQNELLRQFARTRGGFGKPAYTPDLKVQIDVATSALEGGLCHATMLETSGWDTHDDNTQQHVLHENLFANLLLLAQTLEQKALLSRSVVVVLSEMGRTPKLNAGGGKDHWPVTSALVFGAGVRGDRVIGGTDDQLGARSVNLQSGVVDNAGKQLQTGNLAAGVLELVGVDSSAHFPGVEVLDALVA